MLRVKFKALFKLVRPLNLLIFFIATFISPLIFLQSEPNFISYSILAFDAVFIMASAFIINDYFSLEIDKILNKEKVLPSGIISPLEGLAYYVYFILLAIFTSNWINSYYSYIFIFGSIFIYFHAKKLKNVSFYNEVFTSLFYSIPLLIGAFIAGNFNFFLFPFFSVFTVSFIRFLIKDIGTAQNDKVIQRGTLFTKFGFAFIYNIVTLCIVALVFLSLQIYFNQFLAIEYFVIVMGIIAPLLIYVLKLLRGDITQLTLNKINLILKIVYVLCFAAYATGNYFNEKF